MLGEGGDLELPGEGRDDTDPAVQVLLAVQEAVEHPWPVVGVEIRHHQAVQHLRREVTPDEQEAPPRDTDESGTARRSRAPTPPPA